MSVVKYNVGDRVVVKSLEWYNNNKNSDGTVSVPCGFVREMAKYCGKVLTISRVGHSCYSIVGTPFSWSDEMFEGLESEVNGTPKPIKKIDVSILPTDFDACAKLLGVSCHISADGYMGAEFQEFQRLIICRNAYWAIADNWKPNYKNKEKKHCIVMRGNKLGAATTIEISRNFAFPTPEMAQKFHDSFKPKLDFCKDML
jgi:hypothetical protein